MRDEDKWPAIHVYRREVARGNAPAIRCPDCNDELVPVVGAHGDPALKCFYCRTVFSIGLTTWDQIRANIHELAKKVKNEATN